MQRHWKLKFAYTRRPCIDPDTHWPVEIVVSKGPYSVRFSPEGVQDLRASCGVSPEQTMTELVADELEHHPPTDAQWQSRLASPAAFTGISIFGPRRVKLAVHERARLYVIIAEFHKGNHAVAERWMGA